jgi:hypothetical protein
VHLLLIRMGLAPVFWPLHPQGLPGALSWHMTSCLHHAHARDFVQCLGFLLCLLAQGLPDPRPPHPPPPHLPTFSHLLIVNKLPSSFVGSSHAHTVHTLGWIPRPPYSVFHTHTHAHTHTLSLSLSLSLSHTLSLSHMHIEMDSAAAVQRQGCNFFVP